MHVMYDKDLLAPLLLLHGKEIKNVYYYSEYEDHVHFNQIENIEEIPFLGLLIETDTGLFFSIHEFDCSPYYDLGGLRIISREGSHRGDKPNQIDGSNWSKYKNKKIISTEVFDIKYQYANNQNIVVPLGICLSFEGNEALYIMNKYIERYDGQENKYEFVNGQNLVLFFTKAAIDKYDLLSSDNL